MKGQLIDRAVLAELRALSDGDEDLLAEVVTMFVAEAPAQLRELRAALDARDAAGAHRLAHRLKGSARGVGASQVGDIAAAVEAAAQAGNIDDAVGAAGPLDEAFASARAALEREIA